MIIKEYRILMPLRVEEFRIGLLYMLLKKSRNESQGDGNGIEILKNEPYSGEEGTGQYTQKILHVGSHMPKWFRDLAPEDAFKLQEESWNLYPYVNTISTSPFSDKYRIELKSRFIQDRGNTENVFNLSPTELKSRQVVYIDITNTAGEDIKPDEDPSVFRSQKTGRGPLTQNWMNKLDVPVMCCYKLAKVEFRYWGLQSRVERLIHEMAIQKTFALVHRQIWCWQDEWIDLNLSDIRRLEEETANFLKKLMSGELDTIPVINIQSTNGVIGESGDASPAILASSETRSKGHPSIRSIPQSYFLESLHESDDEFYDAVDLREPFDDVEPESSRLHPHGAGEYTFQSSFDNSDEDASQPQEEWDRRSSVYWEPNVDYSELVFHSEEPSAPQRGYTCLLLVVHGGSYLDTGADINVKQYDFQIFSSKLDELRQKHFYQTQNKMVTKLIPCPFICTRALACLGVLKSCPELSQNSLGSGLSFRSALNTTTVEDKLTNFALGAIPLLVRNDKRYVEHLANVINTLNSTYEEFISTTEDFSGQISIVSDCMGSLMTYDILTRFSNDSPLLKFNPHQLFMLGSPVGMILTQDKLMGTGEVQIAGPNCEHVYNIYYERDPLSFRIEPLLDLRTRFLAPVRIHRYSKLPLGDGSSLILQDYLREETGERLDERALSIMDTINTGVEGGNPLDRVNRVLSVSSCAQVMARWWGTGRIDFSVQSPNAVGIELFQNFTAARILYSRYWEANEILSFILRSCLSYTENVHPPLASTHNPNSMFVSTSGDKPEFTRFRSNSSDSTGSKVVQRKRNHLKSFTMAKNFRGIDLIIREGQTQVIQGKFLFGKLDIASLSREQVELFYQDPIEGWSLLDIVNTDTHGVLLYTVPQEKQFPVGVHVIHMLVCGTVSTEVQLAVLPATQTVDAVMFSVDGSFYRDFSVKGNKSKVRPGSVEIVEFWKNHGYLIFYVTARPDMQKNDIMHWFDKKNFPSALTYFNEGVTTDPQAHKSTYIRHLIQDLGVRICAAYGSNKEVQTYGEAGIPQNCIYSLSKKAKLTGSSQCIGECFTNHIQELNITPPPLAKTSVLLATHK
ncbi:Membrane-associated phosphatidylinositol transfer protein 2 [Oopsacas minuta]|uniref:Membrane-associated phosphatidylinositol transfer protein 2 n=1 Tax=Oopsacas minuta TaxID=111878 RepID=A0AAV7K911_9METZ|nr:Membrane-associated phosphatidylinositol transfer protein 2 [Oopsacas minuta]